MYLFILYSQSLHARYFKPQALNQIGDAKRQPRHRARFRGFATTSPASSASFRGFCTEDALLSGFGAFPESPIRLNEYGLNYIGLHIMI